ncbi:hypothetical protein DY000_02003059 [Brassica cretica]|uniref:Uncharacterized protein n=1 Tax=Brassica cretica TaxID=69181 RepID=A0ABQ7CF05_BRACR|nr:hypothetical protein DY000_02003059 [Brassica cretica]
MENSGQGHTFRYLPQAKRRGPYHGSVRRLHLLLSRDGQGRQLKTSFKMENSGQGHTFRYLPQAKRRGPYHGSVRRLHLLVPCRPQ